MNGIKSIIPAAMLLVGLHGHAYRVSDLIEVRVSPDVGSWTIPTGADARFRIAVTDSNIPVEGAVIEYEISEDLMTPRKTGTTTSHDGMTVVDGGTMDNAGFLRCKATAHVGGKTYTAYGTIGFDPAKISPVTSYPEDFVEFWQSKLAEARKADLGSEMTLLPEKCTRTVDVYQVSFCVGTSRKRYYGMLAMPKAPGRYPAIVQYPGAGIYAIDAPVSFAEKGFIAMAVGIHAIPNNLSADIYRDLDGGALNGYPTINMHSRDTYYYKSVIQGAVRAIDFIESLPQSNGCIATYGGSQGGYLSIAVAALHPSVKYLVANFPAMSDLAGYAHGRAGGWPHVFKSEYNRTPELLETLSYYDTANFARHITVPGFYCFGYNDLTCAPTTTYAVYNTITAPKTLVTAPLAGHFLLTEQTDAEKEAMFEFLRECSGATH